MTMPADIRSLAQEAVDLAMVCECGHHRDAHEGHTCMVGQDPPRHCSACGCPRFESQSEAASHAGTHYATIARALLEALDERDEARGSNILNRNAVRRLSAEKDALLAAPPHALRSCGCELIVEERDHGIVKTHRLLGMPEEHEAAIEWLKEKCP